MRPSIRLLRKSSCRITLFTRENCGLCIRAKSALSNVWDSRPFIYREVDIIKSAASAWRDLYEMDVPVIHISRAEVPEEDPGLAWKAVKLMHRFDPDDIRAKMDAVEEDERNK